MDGVMEGQSLKDRKIGDMGMLLACERIRTLAFAAAAFRTAVTHCWRLWVVEEVEHICPIAYPWLLGYCSEDFKMHLLNSITLSDKLSYGKRDFEEIGIFQRADSMSRTIASSTLSDGPEHFLFND
jgi:hypothetical protein